MAFDFPETRGCRIRVAAKGSLAELFRLLRFDKFFNGFRCGIALFKLPLQEVQG